jgi:hypothetical protein
MFYTIHPLVHNENWLRTKNYCCQELCVLLFFYSGCFYAFTLPLVEVSLTIVINKCKKNVQYDKIFGLLSNRVYNKGDIQYRHCYSYNSELWTCVYIEAAHGYLMMWIASVISGIRWPSEKKNPGPPAANNKGDSSWILMIWTCLPPPRSPPPVPLPPSPKSCGYLPSHHSSSFIGPFVY